MKKVLTALTVLFCAVIVFFTLFGEKLYYITSPAVTLTRVSDGIIDENGNILLTVPKDCIFDDNCVYTISAYPGFSMTIYSVSKQEIEASPNPNDASSVLVTSGLRQGQIIVKSSDKRLADGRKVILK